MKNWWTSMIVTLEFEKRNITAENGPKNTNLALKTKNDEMICVCIIQMHLLYYFLGISLKGENTFFWNPFKITWQSFEKDIFLTICVNVLRFICTFNGFQAYQMNISISDELASRKVRERKVRGSKPQGSQVYCTYRANWSVTLLIFNAGDNCNHADLCWSLN